MVIANLNIFISIILPLSMMLFIIKGEARTVMTFLLFGIVAEFLSNLSENLILTETVNNVYFTVNVTPPIEEVLKGLPLLIFVFVFKPKKQLIFEAGIAAGVGFAIMENAFIIASDISSVSFIIAFLRGIGTGMMHAVCTLTVGYGMSFIYTKKRFFVPGTFLFLFMAVIYHSVFNALVQSKYQIIGLCMPIATFIPLLIRIMMQNSKAPKAEQAE